MEIFYTLDNLNVTVNSQVHKRHVLILNGFSPRIIAFADAIIALFNLGDSICIHVGNVYALSSWNGSSALTFFGFFFYKRANLQFKTFA